ncbi:hypothetical protein [Burkholderia gladioli]|uniref:hypothetical protein n=1 Tax=Burkholderia gladioli TaxID=28095 RepID=UPI001ABAA531|nr:hypothetical protein [Burkholderia gladioli]
MLAGIETLVSGGVAGALGFNVQGAATAAQNETLNNFCEHNSCGRALAAVGAVVGGAVTAAGSVAVDVATGGLNIAATPAEVAAGSAAVGSAFGALLNSGNSGDSAASDDTSGSSDTSAGNTNPYKGPVDQPVTVVDKNGNAIPVEPGEQVKTSPNGDYQQANDANGPTGVRLDCGGHPTQKDPVAHGHHGHEPGVTTPDGNPHLPINH